MTFIVTDEGSASDITKTMQIRYIQRRYIMPNVNDSLDAAVTNAVGLVLNNDASRRGSDDDYDDRNINYHDDNDGEDFQQRKVLPSENLATHNSFLENVAPQQLISSLGKLKLLLPLSQKSLPSEKIVTKKSPSENLKKSPSENPLLMVGQSQRSLSEKLFPETKHSLRSTSRSSHRQHSQLASNTTRSETLSSLSLASSINKNLTRAKKSSSSSSSLSSSLSSSSNDLMTTTPNRMIERRNDVRRVCEQLGLDLKDVTRVNMDQSMLSKKYDLYYCPVEKAASTFWRRFFYSLEYTSRVG